MSSSPFVASDWREEHSGSLLGRFTLSIRHWGLIFDGLGLHQDSARQWVTMPSLVEEAKGGRRRYTPLIRFATREQQNKFTECAVEAINELLSGGAA